MLLALDMNDRNVIFVQLEPCRVLARVYVHLLVIKRNLQ
jgi:hypothetical protein